MPATFGLCPTNCYNPRKIVQPPDRPNFALPPLAYRSPEFAETDPDKPHPAYLEIPLGQKRRWAAWIAWILLFATICAVLGWFFFYFTLSIRLAALAVFFMVAFMLVMGYCAGHDFQRGSGHKRF